MPLYFICHGLEAFTIVSAENEDEAIDLVGDPELPSIVKLPETFALDFFVEKGAIVLEECFADGTLCTDSATLLRELLAKLGPPAEAQGARTATELEKLVAQTNACSRRLM